MAGNPGSGGQRFVVVGNPGSRRVALFAAAVRAAGLPPAHVLPWRDVLTGTIAIPTHALVRIDSPGDDPHVDTLLRGHFAHPPHRVNGTGPWYQAFTTALRRLAEVVAGTPRTHLLNDPTEVALMLDKRKCHAHLSQAGLPLPPAITSLPDAAPTIRRRAHTGGNDDGSGGFDALRARLSAVGWSRVFVKPAHGSSASGVVALSVRGDRVEAVSSAAVSSVGLVNSLRVRTYRGGDAVAVVDRVCADPVHVEKWFPKASWRNRTIDMRVVVVAGRATHAVVRASRHPMTNLHLGGERVDVAELRAVVGATKWRQWLDTCEGVAARFPKSLMVGVDLLLGVGWGRHVVGEVNCFGDLLPGLAGLPDGPAPGMDTYEAQVAACMT
ncbi:glutathione synthase/RimK-type ligase-like ATP-grasp enzyme [Actinocrispum wychmicini]|uniref:Glutathione synthase/RimK-type ligase-like ATP-grasp enzyme n=2 Tax=Actinocrispum wychmicini TaxID=1213861 RepID=A0A4R2JAM7_9PSEU|nr:glutathione synthase/RimK-type ligase-like ATP-grasp enzyme [Actinocrispum wychmicini]